MTHTNLHQNPEKPFNLKGGEIFVHKAIQPQGIDVKDEYRTSAGDTTFDVVIEFEHLYKDIAGQTIPKQKRWTEYQNGDALVLANSPEMQTRIEIDQLTTEITTLANASSHLNAISVADYSHDVQQIAHLEKEVVKDELKGATAIVALRAGLPMTEALGFKLDEMVLMDAKRLNNLKDPNKLALGLRFVGDKDDILKKLKAANGKFVNADPALATGSTQLGILLWLLSEGMEVNNFTTLSVGAAQQGLEMLNDVVEELHEQGNTFSFTTVSAGIHPTLTTGEHPFYIKTDSDDFAVGDGGDFLDLLLPPDLRKRWGKRINEGQIAELIQLCPEIVWSSYCKVGDEITLEIMKEIQKALLEKKIEKPVGELFQQ